LAFHVEVSDSALAKAEDYARRIRDHNKEPLEAERWWNGLVDGILSLEANPAPCPLVPEKALARLGFVTGFIRMRGLRVSDLQ
jgi:hypothetical protein